MAVETKDPIIQTVNLCKDYGEVHAVDHLHLQVHPGEVFGLLGPNGAGKTTTTLMLLGLTEPTSGHAFINGLNCTRHSLEVKNIVGYLPDNVGFYPGMTGRDNLIFSGMMNGLSEGDAAKRAEKELERVGMTFAADRNAGTYSRGMRQRLGIADVLMKDPKVIIMDEPTAGIDPEGVRAMTVLIRNLALEEHITLLISSHDLYQIQHISDRVGIFVHGKMIACGKVQELGRQLQNEGLYMFDFTAEKNGEKEWSPEFQQKIREIRDVTIVGRKVDGSIHVEAKRDILLELQKLMVEQDIAVREMHQTGGDLDEIYRKYFEKAEEEEEGGKSNGRDRQSTDDGKEGKSVGLKAKLAAVRGRRKE